MVADFAVLEQARDDVSSLIGDPNFWTSVDYTALREYLQQQQVFQGDLID